MNEVNNLSVQNQHMNPNSIITTRVYSDNTFKNVLNEKEYKHTIQIYYKKHMKDLLYIVYSDNSKILFKIL
jgi:ribosomal protein S17